MTLAQEIASKLEQEWQANENWLGQLMTRTDAALFIDNLLERRAWLANARKVASEKVREEIAL